MDYSYSIPEYFQGTPGDNASNCVGRWGRSKEAQDVLKLGGECLIKLGSWAAVSLFRPHHISPHMRSKPAAPVSVVHTPRESLCHPHCAGSCRTWQPQCLCAPAPCLATGRWLRRGRLQLQMLCILKHALPGHLYSREKFLDCTCRGGSAWLFIVHVSCVGRNGILRSDLSHWQLVLQGASGKCTKR